MQQAGSAKRCCRWDRHSWEGPPHISAHVQHYAPGCEGTSTTGRPTRLIEMVQYDYTQCLTFYSLLQNMLGSLQPA